MELLDVKDLAKETKVSPYTWRTWLRQGKVKSIKIGRAIRVAREDLERFVAEGRR